MQLNACNGCSKALARPKLQPNTRFAQVSRCTQDMPLPNTREYASSVIKRSVKKDTISALDSASSCPTSSSSDGSEAEADIAAARTRSRGRRRLLRLKYSLKADAASYKMPSLHDVIPHDKCSDKALVVIPTLLRKKKISKMEALFLASPSRYVVNDRKSDLVCVVPSLCSQRLVSHNFAVPPAPLLTLHLHRYQHAAHRVEVCLRTECAPQPFTTRRTPQHPDRIARTVYSFMRQRCLADTPACTASSCQYPSACAST